MGIKIFIISSVILYVIIMNNQLQVLSFKIFVYIITSYINTNIITDIIILSFLVNRVNCNMVNSNNTLVNLLDGRNTCDNVVIAPIKSKYSESSKNVYIRPLSKTKVTILPPYSHITLLKHHSNLSIN